MAIVALLGAAQAVTGVFRPSSASRAEKAAQTVVASALSGNLRAVQTLEYRQTIGVAAERAVWAAAYNSLPPAVIETYNRYKSQLAWPPMGEDTPETAAAYVTNHVITVANFQAGATGPGAAVAPDGTALALATAGAANSPLMLIVLVLVGGAAAWYFLKRKR